MDRSFTNVSDLGDVELEAVLDSAKEHYQEGSRKFSKRREFVNLLRIIHRAELDGSILIMLGRRGRSMISSSNHAPAPSHEEKKSDLITLKYRSVPTC